MRNFAAELYSTKIQMKTIDIQENDAQKCPTNAADSKQKSLDDIIREAEFPEDYDVFEDSMLDMIP